MRDLKRRYRENIQEVGSLDRAKSGNPLLQSTALVFEYRSGLRVILLFQPFKIGFSILNRFPITFVIRNLAILSRGSYVNWLRLAMMDLFRFREGGV